MIGNDCVHPPLPPNRHPPLRQPIRGGGGGIRPRLAANEPEFVEAATRAAFSTPDERLRIEVLTLLRGVGWPMASTFLHLCHPDPYPILDYRALWSLGIDSPPPYDFPFWRAYTAHCRELTAQAGVTMRALDRALWQYSRENQ